MNPPIIDMIITRALGQVVLGYPIQLTREETCEFFDSRPEWGTVVGTRRKLGADMLMPGTGFPTRKHTEEIYFVENTEVIPTFDYFGLGNAVRRMATKLSTETPGTRALGPVKKGVYHVN